MGTLQRKMIMGGVAAVAMLVTGGSAFAAVGGYADNPVYVRSGPGVHYPVVDVLRTGESVAIDRCGAGWCQIASPDRNDWVSSRYVTTAANSTYVAPIVVAPDYYPYWGDYGWGYDDGGFFGGFGGGFGHGGFDHGGGHFGGGGHGGGGGGHGGGGHR